MRLLNYAAYISSRLLLFTSFNDRVSIYILSPLPRQPIIYFFFTFFMPLSQLRLENPLIRDPLDFKFNFSAYRFLFEISMETPFKSPSETAFGTTIFIFVNKS